MRKALRGVVRRGRRGAGASGGDARADRAAVAVAAAVGEDLAAAPADGATHAAADDRQGRRARRTLTSVGTSLNAAPVCSSILSGTLAPALNAASATSLAAGWNIAGISMRSAPIPPLTAPGTRVSAAA